MNLGYIGKNIPSVWAKPLLTDLVNPKQWKTIATKDLLEEGYVVYGANGKIGFYNEFTHENPTLMITCRGATCGNLHISEPYSYINGNAMALDKQSVNLVGVNFLRYVLEARGLEDTISGSAQPQITRQGLSEVRIPLPPLAEQKVIADKIDTLLAQVKTTKARLNRIPNILKTFRQSVLSAAVSGKLTEEWQGNTEDWSEKKLRDICLSISDGDHQAPPRTSNGIPFLVISNVRNGFIDFSGVERWVPQYYFDELKEIRRPRRNDILYTVTGSFGIPVIVDTDERFCFQRHIAILKPNSKYLNYKFLFFLLGSIQAFRQADNIATGTAQRTVALNSLRDFKFRIPPLGQQTEIVRRVEELFAFADTIEQKTNTALERVNNLTQSILAKAFRGELTADWRAENPDLISGENSAEALLAKIQAEREKLALKKKAANKTRKKKA
ncbi:MAG: hypothetical protein COB58_02000 [Thalassobium sp.]|nr:MAG: hypothetical protein COB58_14150 [Thalassobium sp.]PHQ87972.1 MAG: hypothetical protein COB58_02000 [Thalassobium sp.]